MQQAQDFSRLRIFLLLAAIVVLGSATLMMIDIPAPQHPIEKQLDAKAFLEQKP